MKAASSLLADAVTDVLAIITVLDSGVAAQTAPRAQSQRRGRARRVLGPPRSGRTDGDNGQQTGHRDAFFRRGRCRPPNAATPTKLTITNTKPTARPLNQPLRK